MKRTLLLLTLLIGTSITYASPSVLLQLGFDKPYFHSATTSTVNIQQSPSSSSLTSVVNSNQFQSVPLGVDGSIIYSFLKKSHWQMGAGLNVASFDMPLAGTGKIGSYTLDQYHYHITIQNYDLLANVDYVKHQWTVGGRLLVGTSRLHAGQFAAEDPTTSYADHTVWHLNYGLQLHALYHVDSHLQIGLQAAYRNDGTAKLGARSNVYHSIGSINQKVRFTYVGMVFGLQL